jgi:hypothetical protein
MISSIICRDLIVVKATEGTRMVPAGESAGRRHPPVLQTNYPLGKQAGRVKAGEMLADTNPLGHTMDA